MADKTELIRQQMAVKREALRQKLDALEDRTLGVVQETTDAVVQVAETVEDTVQSARKAVKKTVKKSAQLFDISSQVDDHPWAMVGGAVAAGFLTSWLMSRGTQQAGPADQVYYTGAEPYARSDEAYAMPSTPATETETQHDSGPGWMGWLMQAFGPSLDTLKQLAIGTSLAVARDVALQAIPPQFGDKLNELFQSWSEQLAGERLPEPETVPTSQPQAGEREMTTPRWEQDRPEEPRQGKKKSHGNGRHHGARR